MAKQVIWSLQAQADRKDVLNYWRIHNQSNSYSKKLNAKFREVIKLISNYPRIGKLTDVNGVCVKIIKDYLILYEETETTIVILTIWDSRQNPTKLEKLLP